MDAGLPIVRSLKILGNQQKPGLLKNIVVEVSEDVETGSSFSEARAKHPKTFDKLYVNMVKAGEAGGVLDVILQRLAGFMERMEALKRKIIGASIYPAVSPSRSRRARHHDLHRPQVRRGVHGQGRVRSRSC
jgi:type IV pilus assembly protein PilC